MQWVAPPTWPEMPPGFAPQPGWQPDPSWPEPPLGWQFWQPVPDDPALPRIRGAAAAVILGAVMAIAGCAGAWLTVQDSSGLLLSLSRSGFQEGADAVVVVVLAAVAALAAACRIAAWELPRIFGRLPVVDGAVMLALTITHAVNEHDRIHQAHSASSAVTGAIGYGLWLAMVGAVVVCLAGFAMESAADPGWWRGAFGRESMTDWLSGVRS